MEKTLTDIEKYFDDYFQTESELAKAFPLPKDTALKIKACLDYPMYSNQHLRMFLRDIIESNLSYPQINL